MPRFVLDRMRAASHYRRSDMTLHTVEEIAVDKASTTRRAVMDC